jgi:energy-coupling factor transporter transmembrane protein EcfT
MFFIVLVFSRNNILIIYLIFLFILEHVECVCVWVSIEVGRLLCVCPEWVSIEVGYKGVGGYK